MEEQTEINKSKEVSQVKKTGLWNRAKKYLKRTGLWNRKTGIKNLASPPVLCVIWGKFLNISVDYKAYGM